VSRRGNDVLGNAEKLDREPPEEKHAGQSGRREHPPGTRSTASPALL
jgi:hypothetical protein